MERKIVGDLEGVISDPNHDEGFYDSTPPPFLKEKYVQRGDTYYFKKKPRVAAFTEKNDTVEVNCLEFQLEDAEQLVADLLKMVEDRGSLNFLMYDVPADIAMLVKTKVQQAQLHLERVVREEKDGFAEIFSQHRGRRHQSEKEEEEEAERAHQEEAERESNAEHEREPEQTIYVIPTITLSGTPPSFVVADDAPKGVKEAVNSANLALKLKRSQQGVTPAEMEISTSQILENAKARSLLAVQADDLAADKVRVTALVLKQSNLGLTAVRCEPAITGNNLDNGVVMRKNPRSGNLYVWMQPAENKGQKQKQKEGKVWIISPSQQENMPQLEVGDHTDGLKAGERQLAQKTSLTRKGPLD